MYTHFRGTTFQFVGQMQNDGTPQDLTNCTLTANVYDPLGETLYGALTVAVLAASNGIVTLSYPNTSTWTIGKARIDALLQFPNGETVASDPIWFRIAQTPIIG